MLRGRLRGVHRPSAAARHPSTLHSYDQLARTAVRRGAPATEDHPQRLRREAGVPNRRRQKGTRSGIRGFAAAGKVIPAPRFQQIRAFTLANGLLKQRVPDRAVVRATDDSEANSRGHSSRVSHRRAGKTGARRNSTAGGHARGGCGSRRRATHASNTNLAWAHPDGQIAENSVEGETTDSDPGGTWLD